MKILHVSDIHADTVNPSSRTDNYFEALLKKMEGITRIVASESVEAIVFTGDFFHKKEPSRVSYKLTHVMREWIFGLSKEAQTLWIWGNHDKQSDNQDFWKNQPLSTIFYPPGVEEIDSGHLTLEPKLVGDCVFVGVDHSYVFDSPEYDFLGLLKKLAEIKESEPSSKMVLALHQAVVPSDRSYPFFVRKLSSFVGSGVDLILCGHIHDEYGVIEYEPGKYFANCGSVTRGSVHEYNLVRKPSVLLIDTSAMNFHQYLLTEVPSEEIFDLEALRINKQMSNEIEEFARSLGDLSVSDELFEVHTSSLSPDELKLFEIYSNTGTKESRRSNLNLLMGTDLFAR